MYSPYLSYAISILAQFNAKPTFLAYKALLWLCKFLYNTKSDKLTLGGSVSAPVVTSFCDNDWSGCVNTRYSRSGHVVFIGNGTQSVKLMLLNLVLKLSS